jgi:hypothetical protein
LTFCIHKDGVTGRTGDPVLVHRHDSQIGNDIGGATFVTAFKDLRARSQSQGR